MTQKSKSTLFLIEQLIVIAVFAICAAACVSILTAAYFYTNDSSATSNAIIKAESAAEVFKATGGDVYAVADIMGGSAFFDVTSDKLLIAYNSDWQIDYYNASYILQLMVHPPDSSGIVIGELHVFRFVNDFGPENALVSLQLATRVESVVMHSE